MNLVHLEDCAFIINPSRYPQYARILKKILKKVQVGEVVESESREHFVREIHRFCRSDLPRLLVWGGDGTAHDAINTLMEEGVRIPGLLQNKAVGFLRGGSGNGIQDSYEVPVRMMSQLACYSESLKHNYTLNVDLLEVRHGSGSRFCQLAGVGMDAEILAVRDGNIITRGPYEGLPKRGILSYVSSALNAYFSEYTGERTRFRLTMHQGKFALRGTRVNAEFSFSKLSTLRSPMMIEMGTRPYYAKMFRVCPDVVCNDGLMGVYLFNIHRRLTVIANLPWVWLGRHDQINKKSARKGAPLIERYEVNRTVLQAETPFLYHVDGELKQADREENGMYTLDVTIHPRVLPLLVPPTFYRKFHLEDENMSIIR